MLLWIYLINQQETIMNELQYAEYEARLINAQDIYFNARPRLDRTTEQEKIFEAGFRMAYNLNLEE